MAGGRKNDDDNDNHHERREIEEIDDDTKMVMARFLKLAQAKFSSSSSDIKFLDELYNQNPDYQPEKDLLMKMNNNGLGKGIVLGVFTFFLLRRGPRYFQKYMLQRQQTTTSSTSASKSSSYQLDPIHQTTKDPFKKTTNASSTTTNSNNGPGIVLRSIKFCLDSFVSLSMAAYGSIIFTDPNQMMQELSEVPLIEGRSLISDELCTDFIQLYRQTPNKHSFEGDNTDISMICIRNFVYNCVKRQTYERDLQQFGMTPSNSNNNNIHISIPPPGVPYDIPVNMDESTLTTIDGEKIFSDELSMSTDEADMFTSDKK